jgi:hypothetical protein
MTRGTKIVLIAFATAMSANTIAADPYCPNVAGVWRDNYGYIWSLGQSPSGPVGGTVFVGSFCGPAWSVFGSTTLPNRFYLLAGNPNWTEGCAGGFSYLGVMQTPGCHTANGLWYNGWFLSFFSMAKACAVPTGETTQPSAWLTEAPTVHQWEMTLLPTGAVFEGRPVTELAGSAVDTCDVPDDDVPPNSGTSGTGGIVLPGNKYYDNVGWTPFGVSYYRSIGRVPCDLTTTQPMIIACNNGSPTFTTNTLVSGIQAITVSSSRSGQTVSRAWP